MAKTTTKELETADDLRQFLSGQPGVLDEIVRDVEVIPTGVWTLDAALGVGGLPLGSVVEFFGKWQTGKSTVAVSTMINALRDGGVLLLDFENSFNPDYFLALGLDVFNQRFVVAQPESFEDGAELTELALKTGKVKLVVWDSLAAASTLAELGESIEKSHVAVKAKLMSLFLRKVRPLLLEYNAVLLVVNHEMEKLGGFAGFGAKQTTTPGGRALKFFAGVRVSFKIRDSVKRQATTEYGDKYQKPIASVIKFTVVKNKFAPPHRQGTFYLFFGSGVSNLATALDLAIADGVIVKTGSVFKFKAPVFSVETNKRGVIATLEYLRADKTAQEELLRAVFEKHRDLIPSYSQGD